MKLRNFSSIGIAISGVVASVTGIVLLFSTPVRTYMAVGHEYFSYIFVAFMLVHILYNIKPLKAYIMSRKLSLPASKELVSNTAIAVLLAVLTIGVAGSKISAMSNATYPGIENIPLNVVLETNGYDYETSIDTLVAGNYKIPEGEITLSALSKANNMNPKALYSVMTKLPEVELAQK
jgi:hypothetical protein